MQTVTHDTEVWNDGKAEGRVEGREEMRIIMQAEIDEMEEENKKLRALLAANNISAVGL